jgi:hypothetical protein
MDVYYNAVQIGVWWSLWSLADTYLLRFTPVSELFVFVTCVGLYFVPNVVSIVRQKTQQGRLKLNDTLDRI